MSKTKKDDPFILELDKNIIDSLGITEDSKLGVFVVEDMIIIRVIRKNLDENVDSHHRHD